MREKIEEYNRWLLKQDISSLNAGLFSGKIGICLYWYIQGKYFHNEKYEKKAEEILDIIYDDNFQKSTFDFENGIIGIALTLAFLIDQRLVEGNPDDVLEDIDDFIIKQLSFEYLDSKIDSPHAMANFLWAGIYLTKRLEGCKVDYKNRFIIERILIEMTNKLSLMIVSQIPEEPITFSPFAYIYNILYFFFLKLGECNVCTDKIKRTIEEWLNNKGMVIPQSVGHRIILLRILNEFQQLFSLDILNDYINSLEVGAKLSICSTKELRDGDIAIRDGISAIAIALVFFKKLSAIDFDLIKNKIENSYLWNIPWENHNNPLGLVDGVMGAICTYQLICK